MRGPLPSYRPEFPPPFLEQAETIAGHRTVPYQLRQRAALVLLLSHQPLVSTSAAAQRVQLPPRSVRRWRHRWATGDFSLDDVTARVRTVLGTPLSRSAAWRILDTDAITPWRYKYWMFPRDPHCAAKAGPSLALYASLWQGEPLGPKDHILSATEKTSLQARRRCHPALPPAPGRAAYSETAYERKGALQYLAAWDVRRGYVMGRCASKPGSAPFGRLVKQGLAEVPSRSGERLFWVVDNGSSHRGAAAKKRLRQVDSRIIVVPTPVHASWLNQVEIYFSIIQRKVLPPNDFADLAAIRLRLALYEERSHHNPPPLQWKFDRTKLTALLAKIEARQRALADVRFTCLQEAA